MESKTTTMRYFSHGVSMVFHPLFMTAYFLVFLFLINPVFIDGNNETANLFLIQLLAATIIFPMIAILMMKNLGFIQSVQMNESKERVGPLLTTSIFYIWMFLNFKKSNYIPDYITYFLLGSTIALFISFFITLFYKLSLHAVAISGLIAGLYIVKSKYYFYDAIIPFFNATLIVNTDIILLLLLVIAGMIGTCRLYLNAHNPRQVYTGYVVGTIAMLLASIFFFK